MCHKREHQELFVLNKMKKVNESEGLSCGGRLFHVRGAENLKDFASNLRQYNRFICLKYLYSLLITFASVFSCYLVSIFASTLVTSIRIVAITGSGIALIVWCTFVNIYIQLVIMYYEWRVMTNGDHYRYDLLLTKEIV